MKTVKVRIAVAVDPKGRTTVVFANRAPLGARIYWVVAELPVPLPVPEAQEIAATVEEARP